MIGEDRSTMLKVIADEGRLDSAQAVSIGLIVTELVINALKHAFPRGAGGHILVGYKAIGDGWTLSVSDDGVGIPKGTVPAKAGLGTSIVEALAKQLGASVDLADTQPGTKASIVRRPIIAGQPDTRLIQPV
jgi:two-component sensor histidine kinase